MRQRYRRQAGHRAGRHGQLSPAEQRLNRWLLQLEALRLGDYLRYVSDRRRLFWNSFWSGLVRGFGAAVGFTVLGALLVLVLKNLARQNLPLIGRLLEDLMAVLQNGAK